MNTMRVSESGTLALVLSGGGARAAYQVGVLSAIAEGYPNLEIPILTGVSAGAINTVYLAAHTGPFSRAVEGLRDQWSRLTPDQVYAVRSHRLGRAVLHWVFNMITRRGSPRPSLRGLMDMAPLGGFLAACMEIDGIQKNIRRGQLRAAALSTTCYSSGQTVTFVQGTADVPLWKRHMRVAVRTNVTVEHLLASAAIPIVFPAVQIGDAFYGDGSVRQTAPLAPAIHLGAERILAIAMRSGEVPECTRRTERYPVAAEVFGLLLHSVFLDSLDADAERLDRVNRLLAALPAEEARASGMRPVELLLLRPSRDLGTIASDFVLDIPALAKLLISGIGGERARSSDFLSYLMFQPDYTGSLIQLGYEDARRRWGEIQDFLSV
jgi:NTE family protein